MFVFNINYFLFVTTLLFLIGVIGLVLNRRNIIIIILSIEIMLLSVNLNFILFSVYLDDAVGYVFVFFILTVAATESAIGLSLLSANFKLKKTIEIEKIKKIKK